MPTLPDRERAEVLGRALRRVRDDIQKQDGAGRSKRVWFQGSEPYLDVLFEVSDGALLWFQVTLRGRAVTWDARGGVVTGHTGELSAEGPLAPASKTVEADAHGDRAVVEAIFRILAARGGEEPFAAAAAVLARWLEAR